MGTIQNHGVMVSGHGTLHAQQVVAGDHARAEMRDGAPGAAGDAQVAEALAELRSRLDVLQENMRELGERVPPEAQAALAVVRDELARPQPNKMVVGAVLEKVGEAVKTVASLAGLVKTVKELAGVAL